MSWIDLVIAAIVVAAVGMRVAIRRRRARERDARWLANSARATGVVERYSVSPETFEVPHEHYTPIIVYRAADGHLCQIAGRSSIEQEPPLGTEIEVAYRPEAPATARIAALPEPWTRSQRAVAAGFLVVAWYALALAIAAARNHFLG